MSAPIAAVVKETKAQKVERLKAAKNPWRRGTRFASSPRRAATQSLLSGPAHI